MKKYPEMDTMKESKFVSLQSKFILSAPVMVPLGNLIIIFLEKFHSLCTPLKKNSKIEVCTFKVQYSTLCVYYSMSKK